jgi:hypothetical protein
MTQQNVAIVEQLSSASDELRALAERMSEAVATFRLDAEAEQATAVETPAEAPADPPVAFPIMPLPQPGTA